jgi:Ca2+-binding EF-hand superfamily protein
MLTELQKRKCTHTFKLWDSDGDGRIVAADFARVADRLAEARGWPNGSSEYADVHQKYAGAWQFLQQFADTSHNDEISLDEWLACYDYEFSNPEVFRQVVVGTADLNFAVTDVDGDGRWSMDEYRLYLRTLTAPEDRAEIVFHHADANNDGYVTKEEFVQLLTEFFLSDDPTAVGNDLLGTY